jgi:acyl carrier protein
MPADASARVRAFIMKNFYAAAGVDLADDASLLDLGIIDSTGVLEVITFLEQSFGIQVEDAEMVPENLDSIVAIKSFVERKLTK